MSQRPFHPRGWGGGGKAWLGSPVPGCADPWEDVSSELQEGRGKEGRQRERMWLAEPGGASLTLGDKVQRKGGQWRGEVWQERRGDRFKKERKERAREIGRGGEREEQWGEKGWR